MTRMLHWVFYVGSYGFDAGRRLKRGRSQPQSDRSAPRAAAQYEGSLKDGGPPGTMLQSQQNASTEVRPECVGLPECLEPPRHGIHETVIFSLGV